MGIIEKLSGKRLLLWGYGREGKSTEQFLKSHCRGYELKIYEGKTLEEAGDPACYDYIIKSPGIPYFTEDERFISQTSLFLEEFSKQTIGITGTKGKSTTTSMLYTVLEQCGRDVRLVGNIGLPCLDYFDSMKADTWAVFEMSCHQLALLHQSPHVAVLLNIFEDHLDYYGTVERYAAAKYRILQNQKPEDVCLVSEALPLPFAPPGKLVRVPVYSEEMLAAEGARYDLSIVGHCHQYNAEVVYRIAAGLLGLPAPEVLAAMQSFRGLAHRLEKIGEYDGITYYDDSISTICESAVQAMESVPEIDSILIGGLDRGIDYSGLADYLKKNPAVKVICMYESGEKIYHMLEGRPNLYLAKALADAVAQAKKVTRKGGACVMSPAAASYGYFKNFEERGERFAELVRN